MTESNRINRKKAQAGMKPWYYDFTQFCPKTFSKIMFMFLYPPIFRSPNGRWERALLVFGTTSVEARLA